jgi:transcription elongation factor GreA
MRRSHGVVAIQVRPPEVLELAIFSGPSLSEALTRFIAAKKDGKKAPLNHHELGRFVAWCGRDRNVLDLTPSEVADYAQYIGLGGIESANRLSPVKSFLSYWKDEGWIQNGLAAHLRLPRTRRTSGRRAGSGSNQEQESTQLSQEGYDNLAAQVAVLKLERTSVVEDIRQAMADKDFRENAPLDAAKERQGVIEGRIRELEASLANAQILSKQGATRIRRSALGTKVSLKDLASGKRIVYTLVDIREADLASGKLSTKSPVGQALLDRSVGDEVVINVPKGTVRYMVEKIAT